VIGLAQCQWRSNHQVFTDFFDNSINDGFRIFVFHDSISPFGEYLQKPENLLRWISNLPFGPDTVPGDYLVLKR
jgi:hypothetical protein